MHAGVMMATVKERAIASWCDAGEMMRIHVYFEPGSDLFTRVFEEVTVRNVTLAD